MFKSEVSILAIKIPSLNKLVSAIDSETKEREGSEFDIDKRFQQQAEDVIKKEGVHNTLFIVNTGHSIPVGFRLFTTYSLPVIFAEDIGCLEEVVLRRLKGQCFSFAKEVQNANATITDSQVVMLDCHASSYSTAQLPNHNYLASKNIKKVVLLDEIRLGPASTESCRIKAYLDELRGNGLEVKRIGIDYRQSKITNDAVFSNQSFFRERRTHERRTPGRRTIVDRESPVEINDSIYAQSKGDKRYILRDGEFYKIVNGHKREMDTQEIAEFKEAIGAVNLKNDTSPGNAL